MARERAARHAFVALLVAIAGVLATGLYLTFEYRPPISDEHAAQVAHRLFGVAALVLAVAVAGLRVTMRRLWLLALPVVVIATAVSGYALPWDQLALWAVTVNSDYSGVLRAAFDDDAVRFVLINGREVSQGAYRNAVLVHLVLLPTLLAVFLFLARGVGGAAGPNDAARRSHGGRRHDAGAGPPQG